MNENPSTIRSKKMLSQALHQLLLEKPYEKITIKEITQMAQLARMTFYTNFKEKDDLFIYVCREKLSEFKNTLKGYETLNNYIIAYEFFNFFKKQKNFIKSLTWNSTQILTGQAELFIMEIVSENHMMPVLKNSEHLQKYEWVFMVGGLLNMSIHWLNADCVESAEEMAKVFTTMVNFY